MSNKNNSFLKDFSWYFLASFLPLFIGFIKTPVFTRHFGKEEYGYLGLVSITFTFLGMLLFSWIGSCIWRYYTQYETNNKLTALYSNLTVLYIIAFIVLLILSLTWYINAEYFLVKQLIFYSFFQIFLNQLFLSYMVIIRLKGEVKFYTLFQSIRALFSVLLALTLVYKFNVNISALVSSLVIIDLLAVIFLVTFNPAKVKLNYRLIKRKNLRELITYGGAGLIINIGFLTIASSDRYIIAWLTDLEAVGIYDQVYKISQLSIVALTTIFFNTINPSLLKELETDYENSVISIQKYIRAFIIFGLPAVIYLSLFSKDISYVLLGKEFRVGYSIMPFIFFAAYFHGLSNFFELRMKFSNKLKRLTLIILFAAIMNMILNYIFVGNFGYKWAAVTTTFTYCVIIILFHYFDKQVLLASTKMRKGFFKILIVLVVQMAIYFIINGIFELNILLKISLGLLFIISYAHIIKKELLETEIPINL